MGSAHFLRTSLLTVKARGTSRSGFGYLDAIHNAQNAVSEGEVFQRAALERIELELLRMYAAQGRYGTQIDT